MTDIIQLSTGRQIAANNGYIGISEDLEVVGGWDDSLMEVQLECSCKYLSSTKECVCLSKKEKIELADRMIDLWKKYKESV